MSNEERDLKDKRINEMKAFRKLGETFNVLGIEMTVAAFGEEYHCGDMTAYYVANGNLKSFGFDYSQLELLKLQNPVLNTPGE